MVCPCAMKRLAYLALTLLATGCAGTLQTAVESASAARRHPTGMSVTYDDRAPMLGGDRIEVAPDGRVRWWRDVPAPLAVGAAPEDAFDDQRTLPGAPDRAPEVTGTADAAALARLTEILAAIAPWDRTHEDEDDGRLERRRAFVEVRLGTDVARAWQWADPTETGDERITAVLRWAEASVRRDPPPAPPPSEEEGPSVDEGPTPVLR